MDTSIAFRHLDTPDDWTRAFDVMKQLRPHLTDAHAFAAQVRRQREESYRLLAACDEDGTILGLAGYRTQTNLLYGRFVYVDDLVVDGTAATQRHRRAIARQGPRDRASMSRCAHFVLDTGLHMALAQRFYYRNGLLAKGMHFVETLAGNGKEAAR